MSTREEIHAVCDDVVVTYEGLASAPDPELDGTRCWAHREILLVLAADLRGADPEGYVVTSWGRDATRNKRVIAEAPDEIIAEANAGADI